MHTLYQKILLWGLQTGPYNSSYKCPSSYLERCICVSLRLPFLRNSNSCPVAIYLFCRIFAQGISIEWNWISFCAIFPELTPKLEAWASIDLWNNYIKLVLYLVVSVINVRIGFTKSRFLMRKHDFLQYLRLLLQFLVAYVVMLSCHRFLDVSMSYSAYRGRLFYTRGHDLSFVIQPRTKHFFHDIMFKKKVGFFAFYPRQ